MPHCTEWCGYPMSPVKCVKSSLRGSTWWVYRIDSDTFVFFGMVIVLLVKGKDVRRHGRSVVFR